MKTVIKPKKGWRSPIGFLIRSAMESTEELSLPPELAFADTVSGWSTLRRSWFLRSPQSTWQAELENPVEKVAKSRPVRTSSRKTRLPFVAKRRTTLIEIVRTKRTAGEALEQVVPGSPFPA